MRKKINNMQMQIPLVTMEKLLMGLIRAEVVVFLTGAIVSIRWAYRDLAKGRHRRMMFLADPSFTILKFIGKDTEEYLNWEMRIESLWRLHECTDN
jgi:hypothetical protein